MNKVNNMDIEAILFDFDGTLVDSEVLHYLSWMKVLAPYGVHYDEHHFCDLFSGVPSLEAAEVIRLEHSLPLSAFELTEQKNLFFVETAQTHTPTLMPHARDVLNRLSKQFRLALVTGSSRAEAFPVLDYYELKSFFEVIVCKDDVVAPKPAPEPYLKAMAALGISASQGIAIEDSATGLKAAINAGLRTLVIPHQHSQKQDFSGAWQRLDNLLQVEPVIISR